MFEKGSVGLVETELFFFMPNSADDIGDVFFLFFSENRI